MRKILFLMLVVIILVAGVAQAEPDPDAMPMSKTDEQTTKQEVNTTGEYRNIRITVNGDKIILLDKNDEQQMSYISGGKIYVPIEPFIEAINGKIEYDEEQNQIAITLAETKESAAGNDVEEKRVEITPDNIRDYFNINFEVKNVVDRSDVNNWNTVTADLVLTCYPTVACDCYNVHFTASAEFNNGWVTSWLGWSKEEISVLLPADGNFTTKKEMKSIGYRYSMNLSETNAWFLVGNRSRGNIDSASGYIIVK